MNFQTLTSRLLHWYKHNARSLPWRDIGDPYAIWVSEVMLQQTRVETAIPYFERWMKRFPSLHVLAEAPQKDVLSHWEGLGYYTRARNLHRAAHIVVEHMQGIIPSDIHSLRSLPGIGEYTAAAIASIAFGQDVVALDGNHRRVLARLFNIKVNLDTPEGKRQLKQYSAALLPIGQSAAFNQALMDLGATICAPRAPRCDACPLQDNCLAFASGVQEQLPIKKKRDAIPHHIVTAAVVTRGKRVLITKRPQEGLLGGMWEFPGGKRQAGEDLEACLQREIREELGVEVHVCRSLGVYKHAYTHFRVTLQAFLCQLPNSSRPQLLQVDDLRWVEVSELFDYPMGKIDRLISQTLQEGDLRAC